MEFNTPELETAKQQLEGMQNQFKSIEIAAIRAQELRVSEEYAVKELQKREEMLDKSIEQKTERVMILEERERTIEKSVSEKTISLNKIKGDFATQIVALANTTNFVDNQKKVLQEIKDKTTIAESNLAEIVSEIDNKKNILIEVSKVIELALSKL